MDETRPNGRTQILKNIDIDFLKSSFSDIDIFNTLSRPDGRTQISTASCSAWLERQNDARA